MVAPGCRIRLTRTTWRFVRSPSLGQPAANLSPPSLILCFYLCCCCCSFSCENQYFGSSAVACFVWLPLVLLSGSFSRPPRHSPRPTPHSNRHPRTNTRPITIAITTSPSTRHSTCVQPTATASSSLSLEGKLRVLADQDLTVDPAVAAARSCTLSTP